MMIDIKEADLPLLQRFYDRSFTYKTLLSTICLSLFVSFGFSLDFGQYPSQAFEGKYNIPPAYKLQSNGWEYKDENNISIGEIKINFAGKFCVILHSCGSGCRFYSLLDLENGIEDYEILSSFNTIPDEREKSSIDELITHKESNLLIVQSFFDNSCTQSSYLLQDTKGKKYLKILSNNTPCTKKQ